MMRPTERPHADRPAALILDYGCVLSLPQPEAIVRAMAQTLGVATTTFEAAYWKHRPPYDSGLPAAEYWMRVMRTLGVDGTDRDRRIEELIKNDVDSWDEPRETMWMLARDARASGLPVALLSNCTAELLTRLRAKRPLSNLFDVVVASCEAGIVKPDVRIFETCLSRLGTPAARTLFVDDREDNLRAARSVGLWTLRFTGDESTASLRAILFGDRS